MAIAIQCECGKEYSVPEDRASKPFKCYLCNRDLVAAVPDQVSSEGIIASPTSPLGPPLAPALSEDDDPTSAALSREWERLQEKANLRRRLGLRDTIVGVILCLGGLLAATTGDRYTIATGLISLGTLIFIMGLRRVMW